MNCSDTISVNPGCITLGALHNDKTESIIQKSQESVSGISTATGQQISGVAASKRDGKEFASMMLTTSTLSPRNYAITLAISRILVSSIFIISGIMILHNGVDLHSPVANISSFAVIEIILGAMLFLGLVTRYAMGASALLFFTISLLSLFSGMFDTTAALFAAVSAIYMIFGGGRYSADYILRRLLLRSEINKRNAEKKNRLTYRAYRLEENI